MDEVEDAADYYLSKVLPEDSTYEGAVAEFDETDPWAPRKPRKRTDTYLEIRELYKSLPARVGDFFATAQTDLFLLSDGFNERIGGHFWAESSREMIKVIEALQGFDETIRPTNGLVSNPPELFGRLVDYLTFLEPSYGSEIPAFTPKLNGYILKKHSVFGLAKPFVTAKYDDGKGRDLHLVGQGSYAKVFKFQDRDTGQWLALKRANAELTDGERTRFVREFNVLHALESSYVISAYLFEQDAWQYTMEFMPFTLKDFIGHNNTKLTFDQRKNIAWQFLHGLSDIHSTKALHRDISLTNVLVKPLVQGGVAVKISDFGLVKIPDSSLTRASTSIKGVFNVRDPLMKSYQEYSMVNEMFSAGMIVNYIFTGRASLVTSGDIGAVVAKATSPIAQQRFDSARSLWQAISTCAGE